MNVFFSSGWKNWLQQPTTLIGLAIMIGSAVGAWTGALHEALTATLLSAALPLLFPDNSSEKNQAETLVQPLAKAMAQHNLRLIVPSVVAAISAELTPRKEQETPASQEER